MIFDTIIIGAGPAGASAAIYAARAGLSVRWLDNRFIPGGQISDSSCVDNYPGLPGISGADLGEAMAKHAANFSMEPVREKVLKLAFNNEDKTWSVHTKKNDYQARTIIYAAGAAHRRLNIPGEEELSGSGVSYCASCDGAFFKGQDTVVIGGGNTACEDALFLTKLCRKVYLVHRRDELRADRILQELVKKTDNLEIIWNHIPEKIEGDTCVTGLGIKSTMPHAAEEQAARIIEASGVFIAVGMVPNSALLSGIASLDETGYVIAGEDCAASAPGLFAAGDVRTKPLRQIVTAVADGANAVTSVQKYLHETGNSAQNK
ncbi:MAG: FAD-dependent oxidoreductase [Blautia sp.]|nr:FAD-dependent oxidoreductase [Blautia sp.]